MHQIEMTEEDRQRWFLPLKEYFISKGLSPEDAEKEIEKSFLECSEGWERAPRDLDTRIKMKTGFHWKSHSNLRPRQKKTDEEILEETPQEDKDDISENYIDSYVKPHEKIWIEERRRVYYSEFDFNPSSDKPLVDQLLVEELIQRRIFKNQLQGTLKNLDSRVLTESLKRMSDIQTKLGITREQRAGILNNIDGNVAQLSVSLDQKLITMTEEEKKNEEEEVQFIAKKRQRPPENILPPVSKIEALLHVGDKGISAQINPDKFAAITEEIAKEIKEIREKSEKPPLIELSEGLDVSG
jgi:hypothetical protein